MLMHHAPLIELIIEASMLFTLLCLMFYYVCLFFFLDPSEDAHVDARVAQSVLCFERAMRVRATPR